MPKLRPNPAGGNCHYNGLYRTDFLICQSFFPGYTKVVLHSRITTDGHGGCQVKHQRGFRLQNFIEPGGIVKFSIGVLLFLGQHRIFPFSQNLIDIQVNPPSILRTSLVTSSIILNPSVVSFLRVSG